MLVLAASCVLPSVSYLFILAVWVICSVSMQREYLQRWGSIWGFQEEQQSRFKTLRDSNVSQRLSFRPRSSSFSSCGSEIDDSGPAVLVLLSSRCHSVSFITFLILSNPPSVLLSKAVAKWRIEWASVSLWEMSLLMWQTELVPYSSESLWITVPLLKLPCARRHICSPSKTQTERKMRAEYKSISSFRSSSVHLSAFHSSSSSSSLISPALWLLCPSFLSACIILPSYLLSKCRHHRPGRVQHQHLSRHGRL